VPTKQGELPVSVDFVSGAVAHRRHYGGGKSQMIAKAIGLKSGIFPAVLDTTAGLGKDAFVLASLGCCVTLLERNKIIHQVLSEGLQRASDHAQETHDTALMATLARMTLLHADAQDYLRQFLRLTQQVIYLDPMFPERKKTAAVKKDMVQLQQIVGKDHDSDLLLERALASNAHRIVVKRPKLAPPLQATVSPSLVFRGTSSRFDVYPRKTLERD
jgi:16S rRNA (guanine1516-N2)-methyltransferase